MRRRSVKKRRTRRPGVGSQSGGGFSTKIHIKVDALGNPLGFMLTGGERHDVPKAPDLWSDQVGEYVLADRSYESDDQIEFIPNHGAIPVILPRKNHKTLRAYDTWRYRERALVEYLINKLKHYFPLFSGFDKLAHRFLAFLPFATAGDLWPKCG